MAGELPDSVIENQAGHNTHHEYIHELLELLDNQSAFEAIGADQGTIANRPAASAVNIFMLYYATDEGKLYFSTGSTWLLLAPEPTGGGGGEVDPLHVESRHSQGILPVGKLYRHERVLALGGSGAFDQEQIDAPSVFWDPKSRRWAMVYAGYKPPGVPEHWLGRDASVGLAFSDDLITWTKANSGNPIFTPLGEGSGEGGCTGPFVYYENGTYYLFYISTSTAGYEGGEKTIRMATATSLTGTWTRQAGPPGAALITKSGSGWRKTAVWRPHIVKRDDVYYLFFNATGDVGVRTDVETIGYATASAITGPWTVDDANSPILPGAGNNAGWNGGWQGDPSLLRYGDLWAMHFYGTGTANGIAFTSDEDFPLGWEMFAQNPIFSAGPAGTFDANFAAKPNVALVDGKLYYFYTSRDVADPTGKLRPALAVSTPPITPAASAPVYAGRKVRTSLTFPVHASDVWGDVEGSALDIKLTAKAGDWIVAGIDAFWGAETPAGYLDVAVVVGGSYVRSLSLGAGINQGHYGIIGCWGPPSEFHAASGMIQYQLVSGDISGGLVTLRPIRRSETVVGRGLFVLANVVPFTFWARNEG